MNANPSDMFQSAAVIIFIQIFPSLAPGSPFNLVSLMEPLKFWAYIVHFSPQNCTQLFLQGALGSF